MKRVQRSVELVIGALLVVGSPCVAAAQSVLEFDGRPTVWLGPVGLTPALALNGMGIDNNVFNEAENPKQDFVARLSPGLDTWLKTGRLTGRLRSGFDFVYFRQYASQRSANTTQDAIVAIRLHRATPFATAQYANVHERPSIEIDSRVRRQNLNLGAGFDVAVGPRLQVRLDGHHATTRFDEDAVYEGTSLAEQLNETVITYRGSVKYALTPLTSVLFSAEHQRDRFEYSQLRDADSVRLGPSVEFAPAALIRGRAFVGVRVFNAASANVPDFTGLVAAIDLGYTYHGSTQLTFRADRDLAYSFSPDAPYYLQTSIGGSVTRRFSPRWDLVLSATRQHASYQPVSGAVQPSPLVDPLLVLGNTGTSYIYGGGTGLLFSGGSRIGFMVDYSARPASVTQRYENLRYYTTISYAF